MSRPDLQKTLLNQFRGMREAARAAENLAADSGSEDTRLFHDGRFMAFADCIRELEKSIEEAK